MSNRATSNHINRNRIAHECDLQPRVRSRGVEWLRRGVWIALFGLHVPIMGLVAWALVRDGVSVEGLGDVVALVCAQAFFYLKARDVSWLRVRGTAQSFAVWALLAALIHPAVIASTAESVVSQAPEVVAVVSVAVGVLVLAGSVRSSSRANAASSDIGFVPRLAWRCASNDWHRPFGARAPPAPLFATHS